MNLEEKVNTSDRTISMHYAPYFGRKQTNDIVHVSFLSTKAERKLCTSPDIDCTNPGTFGSERENSGFSV